MKSLLLIVVGLLLVAVSWMLPLYLGGANAWTDDMAIEFQEASMRYHNAQHSAADHADANHSHGETSSHTTLDEAREEYLHQKEKFESVQSQGQATARVLWWLGIIGLCAGVATYYAVEKPVS